MDIRSLQENLAVLKELDRLITQAEQRIPEHIGIFDRLKYKKQQKELDVLYLKWESIASAKYPMIINAKGNETALSSYSKEVQAEVKKFLKEQSQIKEEPVFKLPSLDDIIKRNTENNDLVHKVLHSRDIVNDQPDPMRKRRKVN